MSLDETKLERFAETRVTELDMFTRDALYLKSYAAMMMAIYELTSEEVADLIRNF